jgi:NTE family protein
MIALLRQAVDPATGEGARWAEMRTHTIRTDRLAQLGASSKLNVEWDVAAMSRTEGCRGASEFRDMSANDPGKRSTADLDVLLAEC